MGRCGLALIVAMGAILALQPSCVRAPAAKPGVAPSRGEVLYRARCAQCHDLVPPSAYTGPQWQGVLARMQPYANLNNEEAAAILEWLENTE